MYLSHGSLTLLCNARFIVQGKRSANLEYLMIKNLPQRKELKVRAYIFGTFSFKKWLLISRGSIETYGEICQVWVYGTLNQ